MLCCEALPAHVRAVCSQLELARTGAAAAAVRIIFSGVTVSKGSGSDRPALHRTLSQPPHQQTHTTTDDASVAADRFRLQQEARCCCASF